MNYGLIYHNNKQTKSPMLRFQKSKQKKISDTNRTNAAVFCGVTGKNFLNTFRKSSKDKSNLKYKTSKNSPNSSHKKIEVVEEYKKFSNEHKDTQPGGKDGNSKKRKSINKNDLYEDLFLKKVKKIYPKGVEHNYNTKLKKSSSNLFNMHSSNIKDQLNINNHKKDTKKYIYGNNISNMDYSGKITNIHIDNSSEENNILFNNNNNKNHSLIGTSINPLGIMVNSSSILPSGNNTNLNINDVRNNQNSGVNINNNIINNISNLININGNETGFVSNPNLMKHIEKMGGITNHGEKSKERPMMEKAYSNLNIKQSDHSKQNSKSKISNINSFNMGNNYNNKFAYPKFMVKYGEDNYSNMNVNNVSKKSSGSSLVNGERIGIGAYSEFKKLNKTAYPSKTNSSKNSLEKRKSKLLGNNNNHNNIFINNDSLLQNNEDNNINDIIINTNRDKSSDYNINIIDNINNENANIDQSKSIKENNNTNINNSSNTNFYSSANNIMKSSKLSNNNSNHNSNTNINNNITNNSNKNVNVIINNSNKNISIINVNNISYNKQKKIEINNSGICNTNRVKNNNYLIKKISGMQARPYVEYISTADKNRNTTNMTNADRKSNKNTEKNLDNNNIIKILHYKKTPMTKTKSCYGRHELHNRSNSGLLTSNQLEMLVSDIIFKKKNNKNIERF